METIDPNQTCWHVQRKCEACGSPMATNGRVVWCCSFGATHGLQKYNETMLPDVVFETLRACDKEEADG